MTCSICGNNRDPDQFRTYKSKLKDGTVVIRHRTACRVCERGNAGRRVAEKKAMRIKVARDQQQDRISAELHRARIRMEMGL